MTSDRHVAGYAGHQDDAATLGAVADHLFCSQLSRMIDPHNVHADQLLVFFKRRFQKPQVAVDPCTRDAYVQLSSKIRLERRESFL